MALHFADYLLELSFIVFNDPLEENQEEGVVLVHVVVEYDLDLKDLMSEREVVYFFLLFGLVEEGEVHFSDLVEDVLDGGVWLLV